MPQYQPQPIYGPPPVRTQPSDRNTAQWDKAKMRRDQYGRLSEGIQSPRNKDTPRRSAPGCEVVVDVPAGRYRADDRGRLVKLSPQEEFDRRRKQATRREERFTRGGVARQGGKGPEWLDHVDASPVPRQNALGERERRALDDAVRAARRADRHVEMAASDFNRDAYQRGTGENYLPYPRSHPMNQGFALDTSELGYAEPWAARGTTDRMGRHQPQAIPAEFQRNMFPGARYDSADRRR